MYHLKPTTTELVPSVGYVHTTVFGGCEESWTSWVKVQSERHALRLIALLDWYSSPCGYAGGFFRSTYYDKKSKRLVSSAGYDI